MHLADSDPVQKEKMIRRSMSSGINLLLIASFIAAPASNMFFPPISFAAPLPVPTWITKIVDGLKTGRLTKSDIDALKKNGAGSYKTLISLVSRINQLATAQKTPYRLDFSGILTVLDPSKVGVTGTVVDAATGKEIGEYDLGVWKYDLGPMKTSVQAPNAMVSD